MDAYNSKICKQLIDLAVLAGCDAVKFQKREIEEVYSKEYLRSSRLIGKLIINE